MRLVISLQRWGHPLIFRHPVSSWSLRGEEAEINVSTKCSNLQLEAVVEAPPILRNSEGVVPHLSRSEPPGLCLRVHLQ